MKLLLNKNIIVTGASRGIGRAIALTAAAEGANLFCVSRHKGSEADRLRDEVEALGQQCYFLAADVSLYEEAERLVAAAVEQLGRIDVLVNNAGITDDALLLRMKPTQWQKVIEVNLNSVFNCSHAAAPHLVRQRKGAIINISSIVGLTGNAGQSNYAASKAGIVGFTRALAKELGPRNVRTNAVAPGFIQTDMTQALPPDIIDHWQAQIPLRRVGTPQDVANTVVFLASDKAAYINGAVICCDGGLVL